MMLLSMLSASPSRAPILADSAIESALVSGDPLDEPVFWLTDAAPTPSATSMNSVSIPASRWAAPVRTVPPLGGGCGVVTQFEVIAVVALFVAGPRCRRERPRRGGRRGGRS